MKNREKKLVLVAWPGIYPLDLRVRPSGEAQIHPPLSSQISQTPDHDPVHQGSDPDVHAQGSNANHPQTIPTPVLQRRHFLPILHVPLRTSWGSGMVTATTFFCVSYFFMKRHQFHPRRMNDPAFGLLINWVPLT